MADEFVLVVDDEAGIRESLSDIFSDEGFQVLTAETGEEALKILQEHTPDLVLLDIWLPGMDGIETLKEINSANETLPVIMISGHANIELAVKATRVGAYDFLEKPLSLEKVLLTSKRALYKGRLEAENRRLRETFTKKHTIVGETPVIKALINQIRMASTSNSRVMIYGESGSGKELVAGMLHETGRRAKMPFVEVNCAAIPQELIESEMFGHEKGSFTGAFERKKGKFELADKGTLFLDEVGDMSLQTQAKVLRVLETQEFQRVGGNRNLKVDVRVISATNKDLKAEVENGSFRNDLFYRLNVIPITVPPLRDRKEDIVLIANHFLNELAVEHGQQPKKISPKGLENMMNYDWPGNVRELRNAIERMVIMTESDIIGGEDFLTVEGGKTDYFFYKSLKAARDAFEQDFLKKKLTENNWNVSRTAEALEIERSNLHRKMKAYGIKAP